MLATIQAARAVAAENPPKDKEKKEWRGAQLGAMLSKISARHPDRFAAVVVAKGGVDVALSLFSVPHIRAEGVALLGTLLASSKVVVQSPALQRFGHAIAHAAMKETKKRDKRKAEKRGNKYRK